jgi:very-short-patch-repair endonuclease
VVALVFAVMPPLSEIARVLEQHARRRAAGQPVPAVLVGSAVVEAWVLGAKGGKVVRLVAADAESAAVAYLADPHVLARLRTRVEARVVAARGTAGIRMAPMERTAFEREVATAVSADVLLDVGDVDAHLLVRHVLDGRPASSDALRPFAAALRVLAEDAPPILLELEPARLDIALRVAIALVEASPLAPIAVATTPEAWGTWLAAPGREHAKAMARPYAIELAQRQPVASPALDRARRLIETARRSGTAEDDDAARSAAERALYEALEADERSRGLFALNGTLTVVFGSRPLEIDLSCRTLRLAVEVDGFFHFRDAGAYRRDRRKDFVLQREGYFVVRVLAEDVADRLDEVVSTIHEAIALLSQRAKERSQ